MRWNTGIGSSRRWRSHRETLAGPALSLVAPALFWLAVATGGLNETAGAVETLQARIASVAAGDWSLAGVEIRLDLGGNELAGELQIAEIVVAAADLSFSDTRVRCGHIGMSAAEFACNDARFSVDLPDIGRREFPGSAHYERATGAVRFDLSAIPLAGSALRVHGRITEDAADIRYAGSALAVAGLIALGARFGGEGYDGSGTVDLTGSLETRGGRVAGLLLSADLRGASLANEAGTVVAEALEGKLAIEARANAGGFTFSVEGSADGGEAYVEPVYANLAENAVRLSAGGSVGGAFDRIELARYSLSLGSALSAGGTLRLSLPPAAGEAVGVSGSLRLSDASFETLYDNLLKVFFAGTLFGDLETAGTLSGNIAFADNAMTSADLEFHGLTADDRQARFAVYGLSGALHWPGPGGNAGDAAASRLHWQGARAYDVPLDEARVTFSLGGDDLELLEPLRIPTLGGALRINRLAVRNFSGDDASGLLDAELEPVELGALTGAFGWPAFSGTLSGELPQLEYDGGLMTVGGTLSARAFDGDIEFANLRLEQPFGRVPRLSGDLRLRQLDLERVTDTFSFGLIQGRLSGDVTGLRMVDWEPTAMDLHLYTPPGDKSRRRISQRAVENLASVGGGGAAAALSSGFMSFFDVFSYRRIGLRCILAGGVCRMSGAGPAGKSEFGQGYYIVEGSGLPRIDVVGYRHEVGWSRLLRQLAQITESGGPTIE